MYRARRPGCDPYVDEEGAAPVPAAYGLSGGEVSVGRQPSHTRTFSVML